MRGEWVTWAIMRRRQTAMALLWAATLAVACARPVPVAYKIEEKRSPRHQVILKNETVSAIRLLPFRVEGPRPVIISPGGRITIILEVAQLSDIEQAAEAWFRRRAGTTRYLAIPNDYIDMVGTDAGFRIEFPGRTIETFRILLEDCWFSSPPLTPTREVPITGPPDEGIPFLSCE